MSELSAIHQQVDAWLQPVTGASSPCGPDLEAEADSTFTDLNIALKGRDATPSFSKDVPAMPAEPPNWDRVRTLAEEMFDRTRDLRIAVDWLRALLHLEGIVALPCGLRLVHGLISNFWENVHPLPEPDSNDPYARVNALSLLSQPEYVLGDLQQVSLVSKRAVGQLRIRGIELALGTKKPRVDEAVLTKEQVTQILADELQANATLREPITESLDILAKLVALLAQHIPEDVPDFAPLISLLRSVESLFPAEAANEPAEGQGDDGNDGGTGGSGASRGALAGTVQSRADALRAIDMVCAYLERTEPTNPAQLMLRRAQRLITQNFLQLVKELAPDSLKEVAKLMGVDPELVKLPGEDQQ